MLTKYAIAMLCLLGGSQANTHTFEEEKDRNFFTPVNRTRDHKDMLAELQDIEAYQTYRGDGDTFNVEFIECYINRWLEKTDQVEDKKGFFLEHPDMVMDKYKDNMEGMAEYLYKPLKTLHMQVDYKMRMNAKKEREAKKSGSLALLQELHPLNMYIVCWCYVKPVAYQFEFKLPELAARGIISEEMGGFFKEQGEVLSDYEFT